MLRPGALRGLARDVAVGALYGTCAALESVYNVVEQARDAVERLAVRLDPEVVPYVCPECYSVGAEPCPSWCREGATRDPFGDSEWQWGDGGRGEDEERAEDEFPW